MTADGSRYILGPIYATLPKRWRYTEHHTSERFLARCAMFSGFVEAAIALLALRIWYMRFFASLGDVYARAVIASGGDGPMAKIPTEVIGGAGFIVFASNPFSWLLLYFFVEGALRLAVAGVIGETWGILPLYMLDIAYRRVARSRARRTLPLVRDEVLPGGANCDLKIASCRVRPDWKYPFTIRYEGKFYQVVANHSPLQGPRPYVYSLRRLPPGEVARGLRDYDPEDALIPDQRVESLN